MSQNYTYRVVDIFRRIWIIGITMNMQIIVYSEYQDRYE